MNKCLEKHTSSFKTIINESLDEILSYVTSPDFCRTPWNCVTIAMGTVQPGRKRGIVHVNRTSFENENKFLIKFHRCRKNICDHEICKKPCSPYNALDDKHTGMIQRNLACQQRKSSTSILEVNREWNVSFADFMRQSSGYDRMKNTPIKRKYKHIRHRIPKGSKQQAPYKKPSCVLYVYKDGSKRKVSFKLHPEMEEFMSRAVDKIEKYVGSLQRPCRKSLSKSKNTEDEFSDDSEYGLQKDTRYIHPIKVKYKDKKGESPKVFDSSDTVFKSGSRRRPVKESKSSKRNIMSFGPIPKEIESPYQSSEDIERNVFVKKGISNGSYSDIPDFLWDDKKVSLSPIPGSKVFKNQGKSGSSRSRSSKNKLERKSTRRFGVSNNDVDIYSEQPNRIRSSLKSGKKSNRPSNSEEKLYQAEKSEKGSKLSSMVKKSKYSQRISSIKHSPSHSLYEEDGSAVSALEDSNKAKQSDLSFKSSKKPEVKSSFKIKSAHYTSSDEEHYKENEFAKLTEPLPRDLKKSRSSKRMKKSSKEFARRSSSMPGSPVSTTSTDDKVSVEERKRKSTTRYSKKLSQPGRLTKEPSKKSSLGKKSSEHYGSQLQGSEKLLYSHTGLKISKRSNEFTDSDSILDEPPEPLQQGSIKTASFGRSGRTSAAFSKRPSSDIGSPVAAVESEEASDEGEVSNLSIRSSTKIKHSLLSEKDRPKISSVRKKSFKPTRSISNIYQKQIKQDSKKSTASEEEDISEEEEHKLLRDLNKSRHTDKSEKDLIAGTSVNNRISRTSGSQLDDSAKRGSSRKGSKKSKRSSGSIKSKKHSRNKSFLNRLSSAPADLEEKKPSRLSSKTLKNSRKSDRSKTSSLKLVRQSSLNQDPHEISRKDPKPPKLSDMSRISFKEPPKMSSLKKKSSFDPQDKSSIRSDEGAQTENDFLLNETKKSEKKSPLPERITRMSVDRLSQEDVIRSRESVRKETDSLKFVTEEESPDHPNEKSDVPQTTHGKFESSMESRLGSSLRLPTQDEIRFSTDHPSETPDTLPQSLEMPERYSTSAGDIAKGNSTKLDSNKESSSLPLHLENQKKIHKESRFYKKLSKSYVPKQRDSRVESKLSGRLSSDGISGNEQIELQKVSRYNSVRGSSKSEIKSLDKEFQPLMRKGTDSIEKSRKSKSLSEEKLEEVKFLDAMKSDNLSDQIRNSRPSTTKTVVRRSSKFPGHTEELATSEKTEYSPSSALGISIPQKYNKFVHICKCFCQKGEQGDDILLTSTSSEEDFKTSNMPSKRIRSIKKFAHKCTCSTKPMSSNSGNNTIKQRKYEKYQNNIPNTHVETKDEALSPIEFTNKDELFKASRALPSNNLSLKRTKIIRTSVEKPSGRHSRLLTPVPPSDKTEFQDIKGRLTNKKSTVKSMNDLRDSIGKMQQSHSKINVKKKDESLTPIKFSEDARSSEIRLTSQNKKSAERFLNDYRHLVGRMSKIHSGVSPSNVSEDNEFVDTTIKSPRMKASKKSNDEFNAGKLSERHSEAPQENSNFSPTITSTPHKSFFIQGSKETTSSINQNDREHKSTITGDLENAPSVSSIRHSKHFRDSGTDPRTSDKSSYTDDKIAQESSDNRESMVQNNNNSQSMTHEGQRFQQSLQQSLSPVTENGSNFMKNISIHERRNIPKEFTTPEQRSIIQYYPCCCCSCEKLEPTTIVIDKPSKNVNRHQQSVLSDDHKKTGRIQFNQERFIPLHKNKKNLPEKLNDTTSSDTLFKNYSSLPGLSRDEFNNTQKHHSSQKDNRFVIINSLKIRSDSERNDYFNPSDSNKYERASVGISDDQSDYLSMNIDGVDSHIVPCKNQKTQVNLRLYDNVEDEFPYHNSKLLQCSTENEISRRDQDLIMNRKTTRERDASKGRYTMTNNTMPTFNCDNSVVYCGQKSSKELYRRIKMVNQATGTDYFDSLEDVTSDEEFGLEEEQLNFHQSSALSINRIYDEEKTSLSSRQIPVVNESFNHFAAFEHNNHFLNNQMTKDSVNTRQRVGEIGRNYPTPMVSNYAQYTDSCIPAECTTSQANRRRQVCNCQSNLSLATDSLPHGYFYDDDVKYCNDRTVHFLNVLENCPNFKHNPLSKSNAHERNKENVCLKNQLFPEGDPFNFHLNPMKIDIIERNLSKTPCAKRQANTIPNMKGDLAKCNANTFQKLPLINDIAGSDNQCFKDIKLNKGSFDLNNNFITYSKSSADKHFSVHCQNIDHSDGDRLKYSQLNSYNPVTLVNSIERFPAECKDEERLCSIDVDNLSKPSNIINSSIFCNSMNVQFPFRQTKLSEQGLIHELPPRHEMRIYECHLSNNKLRSVDGNMREANRYKLCSQDANKSNPSVFHKSALQNESFDGSPGNKLNFVSRNSIRLKEEVFENGEIDLQLPIVKNKNREMGGGDQFNTKTDEIEHFLLKTRNSDSDIPLINDTELLINSKEQSALSTDTVGKALRFRMQISEPISSPFSLIDVNNEFPKNIKMVSEPHHFLSGENTEPIVLTPVPSDGTLNNGPNILGAEPCNAKIRINRLKAKTNDDSNITTQYSKRISTKALYFSRKNNTTPKERLYAKNHKSEDTFETFKTLALSTGSSNENLGNRILFQDESFLSCNNEKSIWKENNLMLKNKRVLFRNSRIQNINSNGQLNNRWKRLKQNFPFINDVGVRQAEIIASSSSFSTSDSDIETQPNNDLMCRKINKDLEVLPIIYCGRTTDKSQTQKSPKKSKNNVKSHATSSHLNSSFGNAISDQGKNKPFKKMEKEAKHKNNYFVNQLIPYCSTRYNLNMFSTSNCFNNPSDINNSKVGRKCLFQDPLTGHRTGFDLR